MSSMSSTLMTRTDKCWVSMVRFEKYAYFRVCTKPGSGFPTSYVVVFFLFSEFRWEVIVRFVDDICGIVDHHFFNLLFIMTQYVYVLKMLYLIRAYVHSCTLGISLTYRLQWMFCKKIISCCYFMKATDYTFDYLEHLIVYVTAFSQMSWNCSWIIWTFLN
jgi:hypothetical protein